MAGADNSAGAPKNLEDLRGVVAGQSLVRAVAERGAGKGFSDGYGRMLGQVMARLAETILPTGDHGSGKARHACARPCGRVLSVVQTRPAHARRRVDPSTLLIH